MITKIADVPETPGAITDNDNTIYTKLVETADFDKPLSGTIRWC